MTTFCDERRNKYEKQICERRKKLRQEKLWQKTRMISKLNCNQHGRQSQTLMFLVSPKMEDQSWHLTTRGPQLILTVKSMFAMVWRLVATTCMYQPSSIHISRDVLVKVVPQNFIKDALLTQDCVTLSTYLWVLYHLLLQFQCWLPEPFWFLKLFIDEISNIL